MNNLTIIGNLTRDPETRDTKVGPVVQFTVAVTQPRNRENTDFFRVAAWGKTGDACMKFLHKGNKVAVTGHVTASAYLAKDGKPAVSLDVNANDVEFLTPKGEAATETPAPQFVQVTDEDSPF